MADPSAYRALSDDQLRSRLQTLSTQPQSSSRDAEIAVITAELHRRLDGPGASIASSLSGLASSATAPLHEVSNTAMWTAIGVAAAAVAVIAIAVVLLYGFHRL